MQTTEYKITLLGEKNIGKTRLVKKLCGLYKEGQIYRPTIGVEVTPIDIHGNHGKIRVNIWDNAGDPRYRGLKEKYHIDSSLIIILTNNSDGHKVFKDEVPAHTPVIYLNTLETKSIEEDRVLFIIYNALINN